jgi:hypothetical protein
MENLLVCFLSQGNWFKSRSKCNDHKIGVCESATGGTVTAPRGGLIPTIAGKVNKAVPMRGMRAV